MFTPNMVRLDVNMVTFTTFDCWAFNTSGGLPQEIIWVDGEVTCNCHMQYAVTIEDGYDDGDPCTDGMYPIPCVVLETSLCGGPDEVEGMMLKSFTDDPTSLPCVDMIPVESCASPDDLFYCPAARTVSCTQCTNVPDNWNNDIECIEFFNAAILTGIQGDAFGIYPNLKSVVFHFGSISLINGMAFNNHKDIKVEFYSMNLGTIMPQAFTAIERLYFRADFTTFTFISPDMFTAIGEVWESVLVPLTHNELYRPISYLYIRFHKLCSFYGNNLNLNSIPYLIYTFQSR